MNLYVRISTNKQIIKENDYTELSDVDCIIILGAGIWGDKPSPMLEDRLLEGTIQDLQDWLKRHYSK